MEDSRLILAGPWIEIWGAVVYLGILVSISILKSARFDRLSERSNSRLSR